MKPIETKNANPNIAISADQLDILRQRLNPSKKERDQIENTIKALAPKMAAICRELQKTPHRPQRRSSTWLRLGWRLFFWTVSATPCESRER